MSPWGRLAAAGLLLLVPAAAGCGSDGADGSRELTVLAAASLTETFTALAAEFESDHPDVEVRLAFDSSATLAEQAVGGAPADVLATADTRTMDRAGQAQAAEPQVFATNEMVLVVPADNPAGVTGFADVADGGTTYVVCVETAPCGAVWAEIASDRGVRAEPASLEVDVKSVLAKVTSGEADAGLVYATDAVAAGAQVRSFPVPGSQDHVTEYPVAPLLQSDDLALAEEFVDLVLSERGRDVLDAAGFGAP